MNVIERILRERERASGRPVCVCGRAHAGAAWSPREGWHDPRIPVIAR